MHLIFTAAGVVLLCFVAIDVFVRRHEFREGLAAYREGKPLCANWPPAKVRGWAAGWKGDNRSRHVR